MLMWWAPPFWAAAISKLGSGKCGTRGEGPAAFLFKLVLARHPELAAPFAFGFTRTIRCPDSFAIATRDGS